MKKLLLTVVACIVMCCASWGDDGRIIRRLYLDTVGVPPTIEELEWYTVYSGQDGYSLAVDYVINKISDAELKNFYLSEEYKASSDILIVKDVLVTIINYQVGRLDMTPSQAEEELIRLGELQYTAAADIIDYFSYCLMARSTTLAETNELLNIFRNAKSEKEGYKNILQHMKTFKDYLYK